MTLREKVTRAMLKHCPIPAEKAFDENHPFHYKNYPDNLYCPLGEEALRAYAEGSGSELKPYIWKGHGKEVPCPPKMASIASSSAMTFNLLGNGQAIIPENRSLPAGTYQVCYEKQMYTLNLGSSPANLDAFLHNDAEQTAVFCEMKLLEWLDRPGSLKDSYLNPEYYFTPDRHAVCNAQDTFRAFQEVIERIRASGFRRYDAWQMLKHLLAIYNYTSFTTKKAVEDFRSIPSLAGKYHRIILANVVNEFPPERVHDAAEYIEALEEERAEAAHFIRIVQSGPIPKLFDNNCNAGIEVKYMSAKDFAACLNMPPEQKDYLKRYF